MYNKKKRDSGKYNKFKRFKGKPRSKLKYPIIKPGADAKLEKAFSEIGVPEKKPFIPDQFQTDAVTAVQNNDCLVTAPTGTGKTWIAIEAIKKVSKKGGKSWYASPLKALSNTKFIEFSDIFGSDHVGLLTGDRKENPDAEVIIGTTEILRNQLYDAMHEGVDFDADLVVLDEAHFLGDPDRGVVWEEIMIYLPVRMSLLLLSATIGNARQISAWLESIRGRECIVIEEKNRPVPLHPIVFHPTGTLLPVFSNAGEEKQKKKVYKKVRSYMDRDFPLFLSPPNRLPPFGKILRVLKKYNLLPAIFFLKSRADCDNAIELCMQNRMSSDSERAHRLETEIDNILGDNSHLKKHRHLWHLNNLAVGAHHSGQLPAWKLVVEHLMSAGLLDAVFATSTVAAGVNFPARTIVMLNSDRFNGVEFLPLSSTEFHQMTGRAGRRGMDNIGFVMAIPGKFMDLGLYIKLLSSVSSNVVSQIRINFSMILNLLLSHSPEQIEGLIERSFAAFQVSQKRKGSLAEKKGPGIRKYLWDDFEKHFNFLLENQYVEVDGQLTIDGVWASKLRIDQPLMVAEGFRKSLFPRSDPALLAGIIASFVNERESEDKFDRSDIPKKLVTRFLKIRKGLKPFARHMFNSGFPVRPLFLQPAVTLYQWASGMPWNKVLEASEMAEGDLAMLILRTADNLKHIRNLEHVFPGTSEAADRAIDTIMRDPVITY